MRVVASIAPTECDVALGPLMLEAGAKLENARLRLWTLGPVDDGEALREQRPLTAFPTVLVLHPLTASPSVSGTTGFWTDMVGKGRALRPWKHRIVSFNALGSCFGSSGPVDPDFPLRVHDAAFEPPPKLVRGSIEFPETLLPATVTPWDQARAILTALDVLGVGELALVVGGSTGGMIAQCLMALAPERTPKVMSIAAPLASSAWMIAQNHLAREAILRDPTFPNAKNGLSLARQIARLSYRTAESMEHKQGRRIAGPTHIKEPMWTSRTPYRAASYLRHHGDTFEFDARTYLCLTHAMDHHDLERQSNAPSLRGVQLTNVRLSTDGLISHLGHAQLSAYCAERGADVHDELLCSMHGHDGFLVEQTALGQLISRALQSE